MPQETRDSSTKMVVGSVISEHFGDNVANSPWFEVGKSLECVPVPSQSGEGPKSMRVRMARGPGWPSHNLQSLSGDPRGLIPHTLARL